jgi:hypothetical protein
MIVLLPVKQPTPMKSFAAEILRWILSLRPIASGAGRRFHKYRVAPRLGTDAVRRRLLFGSARHVVSVEETRPA